MDKPAPTLEVQKVPLWSSGQDLCFWWQGTLTTWVRTPEHKRKKKTQHGTAEDLNFQYGVHCTTCKQVLTHLE